MPSQVNFVPTDPDGAQRTNPLSCEIESPGLLSELPPEPELKLMAMILQDAIACYLRYRDAKGAVAQRERQAAERWLFGRDRRWIFSFENICSHLGADPSFVRGQIRARCLDDAPGTRRRFRPELASRPTNPGE